MYLDKLKQEVLNANLELVERSFLPGEMSRGMIRKQNWSP